MVALAFAAIPLATTASTLDGAQGSGELTFIEIKPPKARLPAGASQQFHVKGLDADGKNIPEAKVSFSFQGAAGTVTKSGKFDAKEAGLGAVLVEVSYLGKVLETVAEVVVLDERSGVTLARVAISPEEIELTVGQTYAFAATAIDSSGEQVTAGISYSWSQQGDLGSVDPTGSFEALAAGQGWIEVTGTLFGSGARGQAKVVVQEPAAAPSGPAGRLSPGFLGGMAAILVIALLAGLWMLFLSWKRRVEEPPFGAKSDHQPGKPALPPIELPAITAKAVPKLEAAKTPDRAGTRTADLDLPLLPFDESPARRPGPRA
ncbi:MAG TPA: hypothetical protein VI893_00480 [Thermoplasmata archaeon]|nr:hypothetical protein [Thermoplasmata archaeon]